MTFPRGDPVETSAEDDVHHGREVGVLLDDVNVLNSHRMSAFRPQPEADYTKDDRWQAHEEGIVIEVLNFEPQEEKRRCRTDENVERTGDIV